MNTSSFHILYIEDSEDWSAYRYFGVWNGETPEAALAQVQKNLPANATRVAVYPVNGGTHFERAGWTRHRGEA